MENSFTQQGQRIDRLMRIVEADTPRDLAPGLLAVDVIMFACQSMWHLKDWIRNDPEFGAADNGKLNAEIHASHCLLVCSDLANGSKHLSLDRPKIGGRLSGYGGIHFDASKGICREFHYVVCPDPSDEFHGMEVVAFLRCCRDRWQEIIIRHRLSRLISG